MFLPLLFTGLALANVFPPDDRVALSQVRDPQILKIAQGSVAIIRKTNARRLTDGRYEFSARSLNQIVGLCPDAPFASEPLIANCSGALVSKDVVLTAGHCVIPDSTTNDISDMLVVFNYHQAKSFVAPKEDVFELKEFVFHSYVGNHGVDLALLRLDRSSGRTPLNYVRTSQTPIGTPLYMLGYPLGTPLKYTDGSTLLAHDSAQHAFRHELDAFAVNSGSPIFNAFTHEIIGVHVRGTGANTARYGRICEDWRVGESGKDWHEANDLTPLPAQYEDL